MIKKWLENKFLIHKYAKLRNFLVDFVNGLLKLEGSVRAMQLKVQFIIFFESLL